ncbi:MAG: ribonuclease III [Patescibacteria group bacterium]
MHFDFEKVNKVLETKLEEEDLFKTAFTHRSYLNEHPDYPNPSNERLEFLGDAVLQFISSEFLYNTYPDCTEGHLTNYRAAIVNTNSLASEAYRLGYGEFLLLSKGEEASGGREREYILANTFEAVLGALYLEKGIGHCKEFLERELLYKVQDIVENEDYKDNKSVFQEMAQEKKGVTPTYEVMDSWGADHNKTFKVGVYLGKKLYGEGQGKSKQKAQQSAAKAALDKLQNE